MNEKTLTAEQLARLNTIEAGLSGLTINLRTAIREADADLIEATLNTMGKRLAEARGILEQ
jgi:hypothetical protein